MAEHQPLLTAGGNGVVRNHRLSVGTVVMERRRTITFWPLLTVAFFLVSGGIYGNEALFESGPPAYVLLLLIIAPLVYSLPLALMTGELGCLMPEEGGITLWIQEACGPLLGAYNAYFLWLGFVVDAAVYPVLAAEYVSDALPDHVAMKGMSERVTARPPSERRKGCSDNFSLRPGFNRRPVHNPVADICVGGCSVCNCLFLGINSLLLNTFHLELSLLLVVVFVCIGSTALIGSLSTAIVLLITCFKLMGTNVLVSLTSVILILSFIPTVIYVLWGVTVMEPKAWISADYPEGNVAWSVMLAWVLWLYSGFLSVGSLAAEVVEPEKNIPRVSLVMIPFVIIFNVWPLATAISQDSDLTHYSAGYLALLAGDLAGQWLEVMFVMGANLCLIGVYIGSTMSAERWAAQFTVQHTDFAEWTEFSTSPTVKWMADDSRTGVPRLFLLITAALCVILVWLPYDFLIEMTMLLVSFASLFFFYTYVRLKIRFPEHDGFSVPGGVSVACLLAFLPFACTAANIYFSVTDDTELFGIRYIKVLSTAGALIIGLVIHLVKFVWFSKPTRPVPSIYPIKEPPIDTLGLNRSTSGGAALSVTTSSSTNPDQTLSCVDSTISPTDHISMAQISNPNGSLPRAHHAFSDQLLGHTTV
eukprot:m.109271 g.109271  ORF g.109271 m.109271 type:complete len:645 (-) comp13372_c0_seq1:334-2268(-)